MKFFLYYFDKYLVKPSTLFSYNLIFLKNNNYFNLKTLNYIHIFLHLNKTLKLKIFKFKYSFLNNIIYVNYIILIVVQVFIVFLNF